MIGLMSGTSIDGLDVVICDITGCGPSTSLNILHFETGQYDENFRKLIREVFAKKEVSSEKLSFLNKLIPNQYYRILQNVLEKTDFSFSDIDVIASHGQTVFHYPKSEVNGSATFQIGDGDHLASLTGIITISDFRQKHVAKGGEGAPLAVYADRILFSHPKNNRLLLNLGGIANFTFLPALDSNQNAFTLDTGPANTLVDQYCQKYFNLSYDENGEIASSGQLIPELLDILLRHEYFYSSFPKSTGQETFHIGWVENCLHSLNLDPETSKFDVITTLSHLTIETICLEISKANIPVNETDFFVSGGGMHNTFLMKGMERKLDKKFNSTDESGISGDAKEAVMMVVLANETICGQPDYSELPKIPGYPSATFGKISFPK